MVNSSAVAQSERHAQLAAALTKVNNRIAAACAATDRDPAEITMIAVTKTYPVSDVLLLAGLGVRDIGENRDQEAAPKSAAVTAAGVDVRWHFVGRLQRNKCRSVAGYAEMVHSVDSVRLATALGDAALRNRDRPLDVLVQVSLDGNPERGGAVAGSDDVERGLAPVAAAIAGQEQLRLAGVMAVAPLDWEVEAAFARLAEISGRLRVEYPDATVIS
ncbi:MAG TPA: YggS family pyridoxal phosphate-dependent enzyme, partial [Micromonosporaceae bacterium]|nr:YggS family pyridoxal phosphate-dependent enzyme [Micromonosporaceae bacterium]